MYPRGLRILPGRSSKKSDTWAVDRENYKIALNHLHFTKGVPGPVTKKLRNKWPILTILAAFVAAGDSNRADGPAGTAPQADCHPLR